MSASPPPWQVWTALGLVYVVWGSTYLAIAYVVDSLPALLSASLRFAVAGVLLAAYLRVRRGRVAFRATRRQAAGALGVGALLLLGGNGLVTLAEQRDVPSGLAALLVAAVPLWVVLLRAGSGDRPARRTLAGVGLGFVGVAVLLLPGARPEGVALLPALMVVGSSLLWSIGSFTATRIDLPRDALLTTTLQMAGGCVALGLAGLGAGERFDVAAVTGTSIAALAYLVVFGSLVAFTAYSWLLGVAPVSQVATYAYVNPVVAVVLGALVAGEAVGGTTLIGGVATVLAVALVVGEQGRRRTPAAPVEPVGQDDLGLTAPQSPVDRQGRERSSNT
ncbi:MAG: EamA family transporter [Frankiales bacterium]|nr:EamA family transporter [Frankiales bacterium]